MNIVDLIVLWFLGLDLALLSLLLIPLALLFWPLALLYAYVVKPLVTDRLGEAKRLRRMARARGVTLDEVKESERRYVEKQVAGRDDI